MNKPFPNQQALNFAAISFAIQYYKDEQHLAHAFKYGTLLNSVTPMPKSQIIRDWVTHFAVARNFVGFGVMAAEEREKAYGTVHDIIFFEGPIGSESSVQRALRIEARLKETLKIKSSLLSATTKLLWLCDKNSIIYDGIVRKKLNTPEGDYIAYCDKWNSEFRKMSSGIEAGVASLYAAKHLFPQEWDLKRDTRESWFLSRTFDTLLWLE
jgi:hypothetical protein